MINEPITIWAGYKIPRRARPRGSCSRPSSAPRT